MKKLFFSLLGLMLMFQACSEADFSEPETNAKQNESAYNGSAHRTTRPNDNYQLKKKFALALHQAMIQHEALREFIKTEARKQFDGDYDVLYNFVKSEEVGNSTFRELLLPYFTNEAELEEIESTIEALTIFVPTLPEDSFSVETWDTEEDVPLVAIRLLDNEKTPIINSGGDSYLFDHDVIPGFPVVVVKECERVVVPSFPNYTSNDDIEYSTRDGFRFKFSHSEFDNINRRPINNLGPNTEHLVEAWENNGEEQNLGWQRDDIYYSVNPANPEGPFINNYAETMRDFRIEGSTPRNALENISDPSTVNNNLSDPELVPLASGGSNDTPSQGSFWTDGKFDFAVYVDYDSGNPDLKKVFDATPESLFEVQYNTYPFTIVIPRPFPFPPYTHTTYHFTISGITQKTLPLNMEIVTWRLHDYSNEWFFRVEEIDLSVENSIRDTSTSKYNTNFEFDFDIKKIGIKWGGSAENTVSTVKSKKWTEESNDLGHTSIHFGDNVIIGETSYGWPFFNNTHYQLRRYYTNQSSFSLVPRKVQ